MSFRPHGRLQTLRDFERRLLDQLQRIVGSKALHTRDNEVRRYTTGYRVGGGKAFAVVRPASLVQLWDCCEACAAADTIIIVQAANTGLTGGSTPWGEYDRPVVVISTERLGGVIPINDGREAICLAGSTLTELEDTLRPLGRLPHSVIGSSCIGASVVGGICNNSGGALVRRGPAFTDKALYGRINESGRLELINHLDRSFCVRPQSALESLDSGWPGEEAATGRVGQGRDPYEVHLRELDQDTPARFNADPRALFEASGCAGKLVVLAVRVPTFPTPTCEQTFLFGTDDPATFAQVRSAFLSMLPQLPDVCEYLHRSASRLAASHGRDICHTLAILGAARMPTVLGAQKRINQIGERIGASPNLSSRISQAVARHTPHPLPGRIRSFIEKHEHILLLTASDGAIESIRDLAAAWAKTQALSTMEADPQEAAAAFRLRFASAGATVRFRDVAPQAGSLAALDVALPRNAMDWQIELPPGLSRQVVAQAIYGHFLCNVFHLDYVLAKGVDQKAFELEIKHLIEARGGRMPAEHNFGQIYEAPPEVKAFYRSLDPTNSLNPGIGKTSRKRNWS